MADIINFRAARLRHVAAQTPAESLDGIACTSQSFDAALLIRVDMGNLPNEAKLRACLAILNASTPTRTIRQRIRAALKRLLGV